MVSRAKIENWARQKYLTNPTFFEKSVKTATGTVKKLVVFVVSVGRG